MIVELGPRNGEPMRVEVGDPTPGGSDYYIRLAGSADVYLMHPKWFEVLERLVVEPPYSENAGS